jgi:hypothetical protein
MRAMVSIVALDELDRVLAHLGLPLDFPKTKASRAPPGAGVDEDGQLEPGQDDWDGKEQAPSED